MVLRPSGLSPKHRGGGTFGSRCLIALSRVPTSSALCQCATNRGASARHFRQNTDGSDRGGWRWRAADMSLTDITSDEIFIVDNDPTVSDLLSAVFGSEGYRVTSFNDGGAFISAA